MGQIVESILTKGGPYAGIILAFGLLNLATLWLALRLALGWADRKQQRLVRAFASHTRRLIKAFRETQGKHDERLGAVEVQVGALVEEVRGRPRQRSSWAATPEQRGSGS